MSSEKVTYIAVVTGDLVNSSKYNGEKRKQLDELLKRGLDIVFNDVGERKDIFRGDSFQIETNVATVLNKVLRLRSYLKVGDVGVRMSIGIGGTDYTAKNVRRSDGEAYQLSGEALDTLEKNEYLKIITPWRDLNRILDTIVVLLDSHFINHSALQAEAVFYALHNIHQLDIAGLLDITQPAVNNRLKGANFNAIEKGLNYFKSEMIMLQKFTKKYIGPIEYYENQLRLEPQKSIHYVEYAILLTEHYKDIKKAQECFEKAIAIDPNNFSTHFNYSYFLTNYLKHYEKASFHYEKAIELNPNQAEIYHNYALLISRIFNDYERAKMLYQKALDINPRQVETYINLADLESKHYGDYDKSRTYYQKALEIDPLNYLVHNNYAGLLWQFYRDNNNALEHFNKSLEIAPNMAVTHYNLAEFLEKEGKKFNEAERHYKIAFELDPSLKKKRKK